MSAPAHSTPHTTHIPVAIIGGGQAGLSVSWYLGRAGIEHTVIESRTAVHAWQSKRWDNFTLVTPNWHCRLPGYAYEGPDPDGFMTRDEVVELIPGLYLGRALLTMPDGEVRLIAYFALREFSDERGATV